MVLGGERFCEHLDRDDRVEFVPIPAAVHSWRRSQSVEADPHGHPNSEIASGQAEFLPYNTAWCAGAIRSPAHQGAGQRCSPKKPVSFATAGVTCSSLS